MLANRIGIFVLGVGLIIASAACGGGTGGGPGGGGSGTSSSSSSSSSGSAPDLEIKNMTVTRGSDSDGFLNMQVVFSATNNTDKPIGMCGLGTLKTDIAYGENVDFEMTCPDNRTCAADDGAFKLCTLQPGESTGIATLMSSGPKCSPGPCEIGEYFLIGDNVTLTLNVFLDDATPVTGVAQATVN